MGWSADILSVKIVPVSKGGVNVNMPKAIK